MKHNDHINERISALLDDELPPGESTEIIELLENDLELKAHWDRYSLIGDIMRGEAVRFSEQNILDGIKAKMDEGGDDRHTTPAIPISHARGYRARWIKPAGGAALAASVAILSVMAFPQLTSYSPEQPQKIATKPVDQTVTGETYLVESQTRWKNLSEPKVESKLNRYLIDHNEFADPGGMGVIPYTNFVSYDSNNR